MASFLTVIDFFFNSDSDGFFFNSEKKTVSASSLSRRSAVCGERQMLACTPFLGSRGTGESPAWDSPLLVSRCVTTRSLRMSSYSLQMVLLVRAWCCVGGGRWRSPAQCQGQPVQYGNPASRDFQGHFLFLFLSPFPFLSLSRFSLPLSSSLPRSLSLSSSLLSRSLSLCLFFSSLSFSLALSLSFSLSLPLLSFSS